MKRICVAGQKAMDARREAQLDAGTSSKPSNKANALFGRNPEGRGFPGGLLCRSACEGDQPFTAPRFAHTISESLRRNRAGLDRRFLKCGSGNMSAPFNDMFAAACAPSRTTLRETESGAL